MPNRSKVSKQVSRRGGGYPKKTGKGTSLKKINIDKYRWEDDPDFKGTPGPYNPRSKKMKKKKYDWDEYINLAPFGPLGTISLDADLPAAKRKHIEAGRLSESSLSKREQKIEDDQDKRGGQYKRLTKEMQDKFDEENRRKYQAAEKKAALLADQEKTGGTIKKSKGGRVKNKHSGYQRHHGGEFVAALYKEK